MPHRPLVSILLPVYNTELYIEESIRSALDQTERDFELLISNNASTDQTLRIIESFSDPRIVIYRQSRNLGAAGNWDFLLQKASGEYACILGADDRFLPNHLERKLSLISSDPEVGIVHGATHIIDSKGEFIGNHEYGSDADNANISFLRGMIYANPLHIGSLVFRMSVVRKHNLHFNSQYKLFFDWKLWIDVLFHSTKCIFDRTITAEYRIHGSSVTSNHKRTTGWPLEAARVGYNSLREHSGKWKQCNVNKLREQSRILFGLAGFGASLLIKNRHQEAYQCLRTFLSLFFNLQKN